MSISKVACKIESKQLVAMDYKAQLNLTWKENKKQISSFSNERIIF